MFLCADSHRIKPDSGICTEPMALYLKTLCYFDRGENRSSTKYNLFNSGTDCKCPALFKFLLMNLQISRHASSQRNALIRPMRFQKPHRSRAIIASLLSCSPPYPYRLVLSNTSRPGKFPKKPLCCFLLGLSPCAAIPCRLNPLPATGCKCRRQRLRWLYWRWGWGIS